MTPRRRKNAEGTRWWKGKRQAFFEVHGKSHSKSFPPTTPDAVLQQWRTTERAKYQLVPDAAGTLGADIIDYLSQVTAMPSYKQRAAHLALWAAALGRDRARASITTAEINRTLNHWLRTPSRPRKGRPSAKEGIAPATVRKRRTALRSLFHTLDGKDAWNPVRASTNPREPKAEARGMEYAIITRILAAMPESPTKRRVEVIAYTGLPPSILAKVERGDLDLTAGTVRVRPRRKGKGVEARTLQLLPQGIEAFKAFAKADAFGAFRAQPANISFQRACKRVGVSGVTLYDLRHSFGALIYRVTKDLATAARFLLHASLTTTARYAKSAMLEVDQDAAAKAGELLGTGSGQASPPPDKR